jgi:hypothetical protein
MCDRVRQSNTDASRKKLLDDKERVFGHRMDSELLAAILLGKAFDIVTDHQSLTWLQGLKEPKGRLARWILASPGKQHENEDTLSRFPPVSSALVPDCSPDEDLMVGVAATEVNASWSKEEIITAQQDDPSIFFGSAEATFFRFRSTLFKHIGLFSKS